MHSYFSHVHISVIFRDDNEALLPKTPANGDLGKE
jgi:hypothetical protein